MRRLSCLLSLGLMACPPGSPDILTGTPPPPPPELRIDLRAHQTPIRNQGGRTTCITFAALAGIEAAYKRETGLELDLSEEFLNHSGKSSWLHFNWNSSSLPPPRMQNVGAGFKENQIGAFGGGGGAGYVRGLSDHLRVVEERLMPYQPWGYDAAAYPELTHEWFDEFWNRQIIADNFNLHPAVLKQAALEAPAFYGVARTARINPSSASEIEGALQRGHEVVWDFVVEGTNEPIWRTCSELAPEACGVLGGHAVLIVGYDKTHSDPKQHYLIIKNSWGRTGVAGADGFTYVSYDYLTRGYDAIEILEVLPPRPMPEFAFMGRWLLSGAGPGDVLDLTRLPGMMQWIFDDQGVGMADRRVGALFARDGHVWRVNGSVQADGSLRLGLSLTTPHLRWDAAGEHVLELRLSADKRALTGAYDGVPLAGRKVLDPTEFRSIGNALVGAGAAVTRGGETVTPLMHLLPMSR